MHERRADQVLEALTGDSDTGSQLSAAKRKPFEESARAEILEWLRDEARAFAPEQRVEVLEWLSDQGRPPMSEKKTR